MALFRANTSGGGSGTSVGDWDYHYYSSISSAVTKNVGYEPQKAICIYGTTSGTQRVTRIYDASVSKTTEVSYLSNGSKEIINMTNSAFKITSNGFTITPASGYTYSLVVVLTSPD